MKLKIILVVVLASTCIIFTGVLIAQPKYTAQAEFSVNWNQMSPGEQDYNPNKARQKFNEKLTNFKVSNQFVSILCQNCNIPSSQSASIAKNLRQYTKVVHIGKNKDGDLYRIQFAGNDQDVALKVVNLLCARFVQRINLNSKFQYGENALPSYKDNAESRDKEQELRNEMADLSQQQNQEHNQERATQIEGIQGQLDGNDLEKMVSGFRTFANIIGIFESPAKIQQEGVING